MKATMKKILAAVMVTATMFSMMSVGVFAKNAIAPGTFEQGAMSIKGTVDLSNTVKIEGHEVTVSDETYFEGTLSGKVEASDLFEDAYNKYVADIKGRMTGLKQWDHLVMFDQGQKFPTAKLTVNFPTDFEVNKADISVKENTVMTSSNTVTQGATPNSFTITFNLGNWNDYEGFFKLYESEKGTVGHAIEVNIPFKVKVSDPSVTDLGQITAEGKCELYKKTWFIETKIVDITGVFSPLTVTR